MDKQSTESVQYYKKMTLHPAGIEKSKIPKSADIQMTDAELVAFYSERYSDADVAEFFKNVRKERLFGLCTLVKPGEFFLDIGCADGGHMDVLYQRGIYGIGLDLAIPNILRGRERYPHLRFIHGFAEEIPFSDNYFNVVLLGDVIEHFRHPRAVLSECLRVARTGIVLCVPVKEECTEEHIHAFTVDTLLSLLDQFNLKITFYNPQGDVIPQDNAVSDLKKFPWLLIRAEKSEDSDTELKKYRSMYSSETENRGKTELLKNDQWRQGQFHSRDPTEIARFRLLSLLIEGNRVLEIGAGNGDSTRALSETGCDVVGIDFSEAGIREAYQHSRIQQSPNSPSFQIMDAIALAFPDNTFDTIIIPEVLEHVKSSRKILQEAVRVVRNGGRIIFSVPDGLLVPWEGHIRIFFRDTLTTELSPYSDTVSWHDLPFKKWIIGSFFVKKDPLFLNKGPVIDILMPTYNGSATIERAIRSVMDQTYGNWNLVVINDGGEDLKNHIEKFHDSRISYTVTEHKGKSHALNSGLQNSRAEYITYLDDDDILYPIHLEELIHGIQKTGAEFVYTDWYEVFCNYTNTEFRREIQFRLDVTPGMLIAQNYINHKCILHSRTLLQETGSYDENLSVLIDWDMIRRLAFKSAPVHIWSLTSERILYYDANNRLQNRISAVWDNDKEKITKFLKIIGEKTKYLGATYDEINEALITLMLGIEEWRRHYNAMTAQRDELNTRINQLHEENDALSLHYNAMTAHRDELNIQINRLKEEKDNLHLHYDAMAVHRDELITQITRLNVEKDNLHLHYDAMTEQRDELNTQITRLNVEKDNLRLHYDAMAAQRDELSERNERQSGEIDRIKTKLNEFKSSKLICFIHKIRKFIISIV